MKRNILILMPSLVGGGAEKVLIDTLNYIDKDRFNIDVCLIINQGVLIPQLPKYVNVISLYNNVSLSYRRDIYLSRFMGINYFFKWKLQKVLGNKKYDTEVSFLEGLPLKMHSIRNSKSLNISWVHIDLLANHYTSGLFVNNEEDLGYKKMDKLIFVSQQALEQFCKLFPSNRVPKQVVYNPIDKQQILKKSEAFVVSKRKFTICSVGRLVHQKGYDRLIRVAKLIADAGYDIDFRIVGEGELKDNLVMLRDSLQLQDIVHFEGFHLNPYPYIKSADIFLSTSNSEGFPLVVCEALTLGIPIVSTKTTGPVELLDDNKFGILTDFDESSIFDALVKLINNDELRNDYALKSLERSKWFNIKKTIKEIENIFCV